MAFLLRRYAYFKLSNFKPNSKYTRTRGDNKVGRINVNNLEKLMKIK